MAGNDRKKSVLCVKVDPDVKYAVMAYAAATGKRAADVITELVMKGLAAPSGQGNVESKG